MAVGYDRHRGVVFTMQVDEESVTFIITIQALEQKFDYMGNDGNNAIYVFEQNRATIEGVARRAYALGNTTLTTTSFQNVGGGMPILD